MSYFDISSIDCDSYKTGNNSTVTFIIYIKFILHYIIPNIDKIKFDKNTLANHLLKIIYTTLN